MATSRLMILGVFREREDVENTISRLNELGYKHEDLSIIMRDKEQAKEMATSTGAQVGEGAVSGATTGAVLGGLAGLLVGIGALTIPGIGALFIAGPLAAALGLTGAAATTVSGAATGALAGGLIGALMGLGLPKEQAEIYEEQVRTGAILLAVSATKVSESEVRQILAEEGATNINTLAV